MIHPVSSRTATKGDPVIIAQHNRIMKWRAIFLTALFTSMALTIWAFWLEKTGQINRLNEQWLSVKFFGAFASLLFFVLAVEMTRYASNLPSPMQEIHREHVHYEQITRPVNVVFEQTDGNRITRNHLQIPGISTEQLISFARIARMNNWAMTRKMAGGVTPRIVNINQRYGEILTELTRLDYAQMDGIRLRFTDAGIEAMEKLAAPLP